MYRGALARDADPARVDGVRLRLVSPSLAVGGPRSGAHGRGAYAEAAALIAPNVHRPDRRGSRAHDARAHMVLSLLLIRLDRFDQAQAAIRRGKYAADSLGIPDALPVLHYQQALLDFSRGQLEDSLAELGSRPRPAEQMQVDWLLPFDSLAALVAIHRDQLIAAERHLVAAEREVAQGGSWYGVDLMTLARARLLAATGEKEAALEAMAIAVAASASAGTATFMPLLAPELARLAAALGDPGRAAMAITRLDRITRLNPGAGSLEAYALQAHGLIDRDRHALITATKLLSGAGRSLEAARAAEDAAALNRLGARELLEAARRTYQRCGAIRDLARVEAALRTLGTRRGVAGARRRPEHGWQALTDTELRVVRLVAERITNPEIAQRMFISRRTVQTHVSHALAKLGVATRRELAAEAARHAGWRLHIEDPSTDDIGKQSQQRRPPVERVRSSALDPSDT